MQPTRAVPVVAEKKRRVATLHLNVASVNSPSGLFYWFSVYRVLQPRYCADKPTFSLLKGA